MTEISGLLQITPAGVTHLINPLEEAGYIERLPDPNDRRIVRIGLTEKGTQVAKALIAEVQENLLGLVNHLGEEDSKTLLRLMSKAIAFFASQFESEEPEAPRLGFLRSLMAGSRQCNHDSATIKISSSRCRT